jgi:hypothetical protein
MPEFASTPSSAMEDRVFKPPQLKWKPRIFGVMAISLKVLALGLNRLIRHGLVTQAAFDKFVALFGPCPEHPLDGRPQAFDP